MSFLLGKKKKKKVVVFLCTGNTCRGPMAQGYMRKALEERVLKNVDVKTAGVMTIAGLIPTPEAVQVMRNAGIDVTQHRSSPLSPELIRKADIILGMTPFHVQFALRMSDDAKGKTYLLKEFAESDVKNYQITDPMGATLEVYKRVYREMKLAIDKMLDTKEFFRDGVPAEEPRKTVAAAAPAAKRNTRSTPGKSGKSTTGAKRKAAKSPAKNKRAASGETQPPASTPTPSTKRKKPVSAKS